MRQTMRRAAVVLTVTVVATACNGADPAPQDEPDGPVVDVTIEGFAFVPAEVTVSVGDTVRWTNRDAVRHTSTAEDGTWDGSVSATPFDVTMTAPGTYEYFCAVHREMRGTVVVEG